MTDPPLPPSALLTRRTRLSTEAAAHSLLGRRVKAADWEFSVDDQNDQHTDDKIPLIASAQKKHPDYAKKFFYLVPASIEFGASPKLFI
jgi:hypothetical protein